MMMVLFVVPRRRRLVRIRSSRWLIQAHAHALHRLYSSNFVVFNANSFFDYRWRVSRIQRCTAGKTRHLFGPLSKVEGHAVTTVAVATLRPGATAYRMLSARNGEDGERTKQRRSERNRIDSFDDTTRAFVAKVSMHVVVVSEREALLGFEVGWRSSGNQFQTAYLNFIKNIFRLVGNYITGLRCDSVKKRSIDSALNQPRTQLTLSNSVR